MKTYLFGISVFAQKLIDCGMLDKYNIRGIFDNSAEKWGKRIWGLEVEVPFYNPDIDIIITVKNSYHLEIIKQLLELGYRRFTIFFKKSEGIYEEKVYDYSLFNYENDKENLVLLFLEYRSYSSIGAIEYMSKNGILKTEPFRLKLFNADIQNNDYYYDLISAKYIITERSWDIRSSMIKAKIIQVWHGFPLKTMGYMMKDYDKKKDGYVDNWVNYNYILSYGLNYTVFMSACYGTSQNQYAITGMPRNDLLFITDGKSNLEEKIPECKGKRIILYMPTFRQMTGVNNGNEDGYLFYWNDFNVEKLEKLCRESNLFFLFKLHPCDTSKVVEWCVKSDCMGILTDELLDDKCLYEYINGADMLITDYSSVYFDYLLLDRPIIFTDYDVDNYEGERGFIAEPADFWRPGPIVHTMTDCMKEIEEIFMGVDKYKKERRRLLPFVHHYQDGDSCQRLFELMRREQKKEEKTGFRN